MVIKPAHPPSIYQCIYQGLPSLPTWLDQRFRPRPFSGVGCDHRGGCCWLLKWPRCGGDADWRILPGGTADAILFLDIFSINHPILRVPNFDPYPMLRGFLPSDRMGRITSSWAVIDLEGHYSTTSNILKQHSTRKISGPLLYINHSHWLSGFFWSFIKFHQVSSTFCFTTGVSPKTHPILPPRPDIPALPTHRKQSIKAAQQKLAIATAPPAKPHWNDHRIWVNPMVNPHEYQNPYER